MPDLITSAEYKAAVGVTGTGADGRIAAAITAASALIIREYEREFVKPNDTVTTRRFRVDEGYVDLAPYDARTITAVVLHPESSAQTLASTAYRPEPLEQLDGVYRAIALSPNLGLDSAHALDFGYALVDVTGTWGFPAVPDGVKRGCIETVRSIVQADPGAWAAVAAEGAARDFASQPVGTYAIPPAARPWLDPFRRYVSIA